MCLQYSPILTSSKLDYFQNTSVLTIVKNKIVLDYFILTIGIRYINLLVSLMSKLG